MPQCPMGYDKGQEWRTRCVLDATADGTYTVTMLPNDAIGTLFRAQRIIPEYRGGDGVGMLLHAAAAYHGQDHILIRLYREVPPGHGALCRVKRGRRLSGHVVWHGHTNSPVIAVPTKQLLHLCAVEVRNRDLYGD